MTAIDFPRVADREGATMADRRDSAWQDPRTWIAILGVMLTIVLAILSYIATQMAAINAAVQDTRSAVLIVSTRQESESKSTNERISKLESAVTTQQQAYNYNFTTRLAQVEAQLKIKQAGREEQ